MIDDRDSLEKTSQKRRGRGKASQKRRGRKAWARRQEGLKNDKLEGRVRKKGGRRKASQKPDIDSQAVQRAEASMLSDGDMDHNNATGNRSDHSLLPWRDCDKYEGQLTSILRSMYQPSVCTAIILATVRRPGTRDSEQSQSKANYDQVDIAYCQLPVLAF